MRAGLVILFSLFVLVQTASIQNIRGAGATFPAQVYENWASSYIAERPNYRVTYNRTGSGTGQSLIIAGKDVVFAGSDSLLTSEQYATVPDLQVRHREFWNSNSQRNIEILNRF